MTGFSKVPAFVEISAERCARASFHGFERGRAMVVPGLTMKIAMLVSVLAPRSVRRTFAGVVGAYLRKKQLRSAVL